MNLRPLWLTVCSLAVAAGLAAKAGVGIAGGGSGSGGTNTVTIPDAVNTLTVSNTLQVGGQLVGQPLVLPRFRAAMETMYDALSTNVPIVLVGDSVGQNGNFNQQIQALYGYAGPGFTGIANWPWGVSGNTYWSSSASGWTTNARPSDATLWGPCGGSITGTNGATITVHNGAGGYFTKWFRVWFKGFAGGGTLRIINPGAQTTNDVDTSLYSGLGSVIITNASEAIHTNVISVLTGTATVYGVDASSPTLNANLNTGPIVSHCGIGGSQARQWVQYGGLLSNYVAQIGAPLVICTLGYNDDSATQAVVDLVAMRSWFPNADFLAVYPYGQSNQVSQAKIREIVAGLRSNNIPVLNNEDVFPWSLMSQLGWLPDGIHASSRGSEAMTLEVVKRLEATVGRYGPLMTSPGNSETTIRAPLQFMHGGRIIAALDPVRWTMTLGNGGLSPTASDVWLNNPGLKITSSGSSALSVYNATHGAFVAIHNGVAYYGTGTATPVAFRANNVSYGTLTSGGIWIWAGTTTNTGTTTFTQPITAPRVAVNAATNFITTVDGTNLVWVTGTTTQRVTLGTYP